MGSSSTPTPLPTLTLTAVRPRGPSRFPTITTKPCDCRKRTCGKQQRRKNLKSLQDLNVYKLVPKSDVPEGQNVIGSTWVFKLKADNKFKARIVAQGWNQVHGRDCYGTSRPRMQASEHPDGACNLCREELGGYSSGRQHCLLVRFVRRGGKGASRNATRIRAIHQGRRPVRHVSPEESLRTCSKPAQLLSLIHI